MKEIQEVNYVNVHYSEMFIFLLHCWTEFWWNSLMDGVHYAFLFRSLEKCNYSTYVMYIWYFRVRVLMESCSQLHACVCVLGIRPRLPAAEPTWPRYNCVRTRQHARMAAVTSLAAARQLSARVFRYYCRAAAVLLLASLLAWCTALYCCYTHVCRQHIVWPISVPKPDDQRSQWAQLTVPTTRQPFWVHTDPRVGAVIQRTLVVSWWWCL